MSDDRIQVQVITPAGVVYDKEVSLVDVPLAGGQIGIMPKSEPILGAIVDGPMKCVRDGGQDYLCVSEGLLEVSNNKVNVLVNSAENASEIDPIRCEGAMERANEDLQNEGLDPVEKETARRNLDRAKARLKTYHLYHGD